MGYSDCSYNGMCFLITLTLREVTTYFQGCNNPNCGKYKKEREGNYCNICGTKLEKFPKVEKKYPTVDGLITEKESEEFSDKFLIVHPEWFVDTDIQPRPRKNRFQFILLENKHRELRNLSFNEKKEKIEEIYKNEIEIIKKAVGEENFKIECGLIEYRI